MDEFAYIAIQFVAQLPALIVLVVGLVLVATRRRTLNGRAAPLAIAGCVVLFAGILLSAVWASAVPWLVDAGDFDVRDFGLLSSAVGLGRTLIEATGLALVIAAVLAGRQPAAPIPRDEPAPGMHIRP